MHLLFIMDRLWQACKIDDATLLFIEREYWKWTFIVNKYIFSLIIMIYLMFISSETCTIRRTGVNLLSVDEFTFFTMRFDNATLAVCFVYFPWICLIWCRANARASLIDNISNGIFIDGYYAWNKYILAEHTIFSLSRRISQIIYYIWSGWSWRVCPNTLPFTDS